LAASRRMKRGKIALSFRLKLRCAAEAEPLRDHAHVRIGFFRAGVATSTSTMIGRAWPFHVAGSPATLLHHETCDARQRFGGLGYADLLASAWLVKAITSRAEGATVSAVRISTFPNDLFSTRAFFPLCLGNLQHTIRPTPIPLEPRFRLNRNRGSHLIFLTRFS